MLNIHQIGSNKVKYLQSKMSQPQRGWSPKTFPKNKESRLNCYSLLHYASTTVSFEVDFTVTTCFPL